MSSTTLPTQSIGISRVVQNWGWFVDTTFQGAHYLITHNQSHGRGQGRKMRLKVSCVAIPPSYYREAEKRVRVPHVVHRVPSSELRRTLSRTIDNIKLTAAQGKPEHYVLAHKMQGAYDRTFKSPAGEVVYQQPASDGTEKIVLVDVGWYAQAMGVDPSLFRERELSVAPVGLGV